jgi:hypothetical protein
MSRSLNLWSTSARTLAYAIPACAALFGCSSENGSSEAETLGSGSLSVTAAPPPDYPPPPGGTFCLLVSVQRNSTGGPSATEAFPVAAGGADPFPMAQVPAGWVTVAATLFDSAPSSSSTCGGQAIYAGSASAFVPPGGTASVALDLDAAPGDLDIDLGYGSLGTPPAPVGGFRDDFDAPLSPTDWVTSFTQGASSVYVLDGSLILETVPNTGCASVSVHGLRTFAPANGPITYESVVRTYVDQGIYGDSQPRGLAAGSDRNNAVEFISTYPVPDHVICRSVKDGVPTETVVNIGQSVYASADYKIVVSGGSATFFVNGTLVATHGTNVPVVPLNAYYGTGDSCAGNVPVLVDWVSITQ